MSRGKHRTPDTTQVGFEEKVRQLSKMLDELYGEIKLEEEHDVTVKLYFDAIDVRAVVFGWEDFYNGFTFELNEFDSDETLVQCLTAGGWLGTISILSPHQAELLVALRARRDKGQIDLTVDDFLNEISSRKSIPSLSSLEPGEFYDHVTEYAGSSKRAFNAIQCVRDVFWKRRLARLIGKQVIAFTSGSEMNEKVVHSDRFRLLKRTFDAERKNQTLNNFADAAVLVLLIDATEQFNQGASKILPLFYTSTSPLFNRVIDKAGLSEHLQYTYGDYSGSVLKQPDYFILRSTFHPPEEKRAFRSEKGDSKIRNGLLKEMRDELILLVDSDSIGITQETPLISIGELLGDIAEQIEQFLFFKYVWTEELGREEAGQILEDLNLEELGKDEFIEEVNHAFDQVLEELRRNADEQRWISNLWTKLVKKIEKARKQERTTELDVVRDFRLFRFSLPESSLEQIQNVFTALLKEGEETEKDPSFIDVINACYTLYEDVESSPEEKIQRLALASAVLWMMDMCQELVELLKDPSSLPHHSFKLIYVASMIQMEQKKQKKEKLVEQQGTGTTVATIDKSLKDLEEDYKKAIADNEDQDQAELAIGLGYLHFHYWWLLGFSAPWRTSDETKTARVSSEIGDRLIGKAISYAHDAHKLLSVFDPMKRMYVLNQYLYYMVEWGDLALEEQMREVIQELTTYRETHDPLWQYTYDDTLARFYHRIALSARDEGNEESHKDRLRTALDRSRAASKQSDGKDESVEAHKSQLEILVL